MMERLVIVRRGKSEYFAGWAKDRRHAKFLVNDEVYGDLFVTGIMAGDLKEGKAMFRGHELPAYILDLVDSLT